MTKSFIKFFKISEIPIGYSMQGGGENKKYSQYTQLFEMVEPTLLLYHGRNPKTNKPGLL